MKKLVAQILIAVMAGCGWGEPEDGAQPIEPVVVVDGLNGPIGLHVESDGTLWISDSGTADEVGAAAAEAKGESAGVGAGADSVAVGDPAMTADSGQAMPVEAAPRSDGLAARPFWNETARLLRVGTDGTVTEVLRLPVLVTAEGPQGAGRMAWLDGGLYVTSGAWSDGMTGERPLNMAAVVELKEGRSREFATTWEIERRDNPAGAAVETNPFDLTVGPDGGLWLTDAAGNTLYRIDPETGALELRAVFEDLTIAEATQAEGDRTGVEPVPTAIAFDGAGDAYVAFLPGLPFVPGSGRVVRVGDDGTTRVHANGLTMLTDLVTGPDGRLYGVSIGEVSDKGPVPNSGAIVRIEKGASSEVIMGGLSYPTTLVFAANGDAFVAINGIGAPGSGRIVKYERLVGVH